jgi:hypothetical protein
MSHAPNLAPQLELAVTIAPVTEDEVGYCLGSWREALMTTPENRRVPKGIFRRSITPQLTDILNASEVLTAHVDGAIAGWIAFQRGPRVSACHWVHTRYESRDGMPLRRRGIMTALLEAADLGPRFLYTHRGSLPRHPRPEDKRTTTDEIVRRWLAKRGVTAVHVPYQEWIR